MSDTPRNLNPANAADAAEIVGVLVGKLRMDGLTGGEVAALLQSIQTLSAAVAPKPAESDNG
jgi:hypothetical protein